MKGFFYAYLLFQIISLIVIWRKIEPGKGRPSNQPLVTFSADSFVDHYICPEQGRTKIQPHWASELDARLPQLQKAWDANGPPLIQKTVEMTGMQMSHSVYDLPVFLCPVLPSWGFPIAMAGNNYLPSVDPSLQWSELEWVNAVFHELLHYYVVEALHWNYWTPMLTKYKDEATYTKFHLHLYALQKEAYTRLGRQAEWVTTVQRAKSSFAPEYSRAIDIVEKEGTASFLVELRQK